VERLAVLEREVKGYRFSFAREGIWGGLSQALSLGRVT